MAEKKNEKNEVRSRAKPDENDSKKKTSKKTGAKSESFEKNIIRDSETAKKRGANGGKKSGEVRRAKRDARETALRLLEAMSKSENIKKNLKELGLDREDFSNLSALFGRLYSMAMSGDLDAFKLLMTYAGFNPEENRKERESLSSQTRKDMEMEAKFAALTGNIDNADIAMNLNDDEGNNDIVIYMPKMKTEEDVELPPEENDDEKDNSGE